jgi:glycosyltransferase involved in cell wall biosynthesis
MGLRVGIVTESYEPGAGGAWTFSAMLTEAIRTVQSPHAFINLDSAKFGAELEQSTAVRQQPPVPRLIRAAADKAAALARRAFGKGNPTTLDTAHENQGYINSLEALAQRERIDIVWFMTPMNEPLPLPYIATVWDLEHRNQPYFPEVSTTGVTWTARENVYSALLPRASLIITGTQAGKDEIVHYYRVNPGNVLVIPFPVPAAALTSQPPDPAAIKKKYQINGGFLLYPAQFWPHKNHVNLVRALRALRDQGHLDLSLVLTGSDKGNLAHVMAEAAKLDLSGHVLAPGFVSREDLNDLCRASAALVFPSFFGPDNLPPLEAFALGVPVVAANV